MPTRSTIDRLETTVEEQSLTVRLADTASVRFERRDGVGRVRLAFGRSGIGPDVSIQPAAVDRVIRDRARLAGIDPNRWCGEVLGHLLDWEPGLEWVGRRPDRLVAATGAFTHPLLADLYRHGKTPLGEVPRWASLILRAGGTGGAARRLAGDSANRHTVAVVGRLLLARDAVIDFERLALAVAAAGLVTTDELANVMSAPLQDEPLPAPLIVAEVEAIRTGLGWYPPDRRVALLIDVARNHRAADLARDLSRLRWIVDRAPRPLPVRLSGIEELIGRLVPVIAPTPPTPTPPPAPATAGSTSAVAAAGSTRTPVRRRREPQREVVPHPAETADRPRTRPAHPAARPGQTPRLAPAAPASNATVWPIHPDLVPVNGHRIDDVTLCVPTSVAELAAWSRRLHNCLDGYGAAVAHDRSWIIGIRRDDDLLGAIEVSPGDRRLRQAQGPRNRALPNDLHDRAVAALADLGVLRVTPSR